MTKRMAVPWQADFFECNEHWWPSQRPDVVFGEADFAKLMNLDQEIAKTQPGSTERTALEAANTARCTCGCGMTLAQCVSTDMTCPVREGNIEKIKTMVRDAMATPRS